MSAREKKKAQKRVQAIKTEEQKDQDFLDAYKKLCEKHQRGLSASPSWRYSQDGNDFRLVINLSVTRMQPDK
jgi:hypothetical protein